MRKENPRDPAFGLRLASNNIHAHLIRNFKRNGKLQGDSRSRWSSILTSDESRGQVFDFSGPYSDPKFYKYGTLPMAARSDPLKPAPVSHKSRYVVRVTRRFETKLETC